ncbi:MAG TPA: TlpA disulfide reductase family protein [Candidatus Dormibacteraeota bacterium]|nr:TlpA disulfide reductase family protein [Candidatus Dormibacteraeota bacterium]
MKRNLKTGAAVAFVAVLLVIFIRPSYRNGQPSLHGQSAKDFALTIDGRPTRLSDLRGKVVLLNFWATWCQPCVDEAPSLNALQKKIAPMGGMVLGVSVDDDQAAYEQFLKTYNIDYPTYRDPSKQIPLSYGTSMYPETYVIDRDGRINSKIVGPQDWTSPAMMAYLDGVLRAK